MLYTLLPIIKGIQKWSSHANCFGTKTQTFYDVGSSSNTTIDEYLDNVEYLRT